MYAIGASIAFTVTTAAGQEWHGAKHLPTFYLDRNVQGIINKEHAERIARDILDPFGTYGDRLVVGAVAL